MKSGCGRAFAGAETCPCLTVMAFGEGPDKPVEEHAVFARMLFICVCTYDLQGKHCGRQYRLFAPGHTCYPAGKAAQCSW